MSAQWSVILNPAAGGGKGKREWRKTAGFLAQEGIEYTLYTSEGPGHIRELAAEALRNGDRSILVVGGDGSVNEAVNGLFSQGHCPEGVRLAHIPVGVGNDWGKTLGIPSDPLEATRCIAAGNTVCQDVGGVTYQANGNEQKKFFVNEAGLGFDAMVVDKTAGLKKIAFGRSWLYLATLFRCLLKDKSTRVMVNMDGEELGDTVFSLCAGIGRYSGGGMRQTPEAVVDDGLFDLTVIKHMGVLEVLANVKRLYDGTLLEHPKVIGLRGKEIQIASDPPIQVEADGELLGMTPVKLEILSGHLSVISGVL